MKNKIGEYYWHIFMINGQCDPALGELFGDIERRVGEIAELEEEVQIIEDGMDKLIQPPVTLQLGFTTCGSQNAALGGDMALEDKTENGGACHLCGASLPDDAIFCYTCGARVTI
jgi:hypothetical protein